MTGPARLDVEVQAEAIGSTLDPVVQLGAQDVWWTRV
jgi:hypothetical protein